MHTRRTALRSDTRWVAARFDRIAPFYDLFPWLMCVPRHAHKLAVEQLDLAEGHRVLYVGCGKGPQLRPISEQVGKQGHVTGLDLSGRMLAKARQKVSKWQLNNVELIQEDLLNYQHSDPFDAILFEFSLSSFGDADAALAHAWRMLASGGRLVILDAQLPPGMRWFTRPLMPVIRWFLETTVLGDPDMEIQQALETLQRPVSTVYMLRRTYFVARVLKPI